MFPGTLYETHVKTKNLEAAMEFYTRLGLDLAHTIEDRRVAFYWFDKNNKREQMLGVWEVPEEEFHKSHFAFKVTYDDIIHASEWLLTKGIRPRAAFGLEPTEPMVQTWTPTANLYFYDPDGNSLEFLCLLPEKKNVEKDVMYLSEWEKLS
ncbi:VOC family protein [Fictibacillus sp. WQ 8-8]|uniref:VOC family protein n=1 Tax=unclassified Fictibacillus TaxID=2644029 RepID=UPI00210C1033|nr:MULTISPECIES: VOC family protein [unclassified Fictibacillus]MCQ6268649.1 VOC family protein [Fictibacillus sp. WQ 8-8]MED2975022.1 VOC family protein [Fictibacillus sp. B-59209]UZJ78555.1 VOC family protein [Fictibacillus sp. KU28468]